MRNFWALLTVSTLAASPLQARADFSLGTAGNFAVLGGSAVNNTGLSVIIGGDVGVSPGSSITGFSPGIVVGPNIFHAGDAVAANAQRDLTAAYNAAAALTPTQNLSGQNLGGMILTPGTYFFSSTAQLNGVLILNDLGNPNAQFVFQIGSTLTTETGSAIVTINGGLLPGRNVFWQVGAAATLGTGSVFQGHILANTGITATAGVSVVDGSLLTMNGAVSLDTDNIINPGAAVVPEPASLMLSSLGGLCLAMPTFAKQLRKRRVVKQEALN